MSLPEVLLWKALKSAPDLHFRKQHPVGPYVLLASPNDAVLTITTFIADHPP